MKKKYLILLIIIILIILIYLILDYLSLIPHKTFSNADFNISSYQSKIDKDNDGLDDQTDILLNARNYIETKPKYKSKYYSTGYPSDNYGVCTDVIGFALLNAGYDIKELLNKDVLENKDIYNIETVDKNIDFRRVNNLKTYFERNALKLTLDLNDVKEWQGGDIVVFPKHIGIVSDKRNKKGIPYLIHHGGQIVYEEDVLNRYQIVGHYRIS